MFHVIVHHRNICHDNVVDDLLGVWRDLFGQGAGPPVSRLSERVSPRLHADMAQQERHDGGAASERHLPILCQCI